MADIIPSSFPSKNVGDVMYHEQFIVSPICQISESLASCILRVSNDVELNK